MSLDAEKERKRRQLGLFQRRKSSVSQRPPIDTRDLPSSYSTNTSKEELMLLYVQNFSLQFQRIYPDRKAPFVAARNEVDSQKMICSFVRPSCTKYEELNSWKNCAEFVADFFQYEPLLTVLEEPKWIYSPLTLCYQRLANCFEMSCYLCSLLIGLGYDAYVMNGYATYDVCHVNLEREEWIISETEEKSFKTISPSPRLSQEQRRSSSSAAAEVAASQEYLEETTALENGPHMYPIAPVKVEVTSKFDDKLERREILKQEMKKKKLLDIELAKLKDDQKPPEDPLYGQRVHSWVLVKSGRMEVAEPFFIETTTGRRNSVDDERYLGLESIWNHLNFWINMQSCENGVKDISYNFKDDGLWECFLPYLPIELTLDPSLEEGIDEAIVSCIDQEIYDMPQSWIPSIEITPKDLQNRLPRGKKVELYKYYKIEKFDPYTQKDGLILRSSKYKTWTRHGLLTVEEKFQRRSDKLYRKVQNYENETVTEYFMPGQHHCLKEHTYMMNDVSLQSDRTLVFYHKKRVDSLARREYLQDELIDYYEDRMDFLKYRRAYFTPRVKIFGSADTPRRNIEIVHEKFDDDPSKAPKDNVAEVIYKEAEGKIKIVYHLLENKLLPSWREFTRQSSQDYGKLFEIKKIMKEYQADPHAPRLKKLEACLMLQQYRKQELVIMSKVRQAETELQTLLNERFKEETTSILYVSPYDVVHNENNRKMRLQQEREELEERQNEEREPDYLLPYLLQLDINPIASLTHKQVMVLSDACLNDCKKQMMDKYALIAKLYEKESQKLKQQEAWFLEHQESLTAQEEEEHHFRCQEIKLKIQLVEQRLAQHRENAPMKYLALEKKMKSDPRFLMY